jgi:site-specific DNA recombinase
MKSEALLTGRIYDDGGNLMSPSHTRKGGIKYRYYLSSALLHGMAERAGSICRVPAAEIEAVVVASVREHLRASPSVDDRSLIATHVARVRRQPERVRSLGNTGCGEDSPQPRSGQPVLTHTGQ